MPSFSSDGLTLHYERHGAGKPVVLVHGFASSGEVNWVGTSWVETLAGAGYEAVTLDNRGHGRSDRPHDPALYTARAMGRDVINLIDRLGLGAVALVGYSMGARIAAHVLLDAPEKVRCAVFGGLGENMFRGMADSEEIIAALRAPSRDAVTHPTGRQFRIFAEHTGSDLEALAACMQSSRAAIPAGELARINRPVLVAVGEKDETAGAPGTLAEALPRGEAFTIPGRDHMRATGDPQFKAAVLAFLARHVG